MRFRTIMKSIQFASLLLLATAFAHGVSPADEEILPTGAKALPDMPILNRPQEAEPVKGTVGWLQRKGFAELDGNGHRTGYDLKLLEEIAEKGNIQLEYREVSSRDELRRLVAEGEVDLTTVFDREDISEEMESLHRSIGPVIRMICARENDTRFFSNEFSAMDGMTLALSKKHSTKSRVEKFEQEWGFTTKKLYCSSSAANKEALLDGSADLAVLDNYEDKSGLMVIAKFGMSDRQLSIRAGREDLKAALLRGYANCLLDDPFILQRLNEKYFSGQDVMNVALSREEYEFMQDAPVLNVYTRDDIPMIACCHNEALTGYFPAMLENISERTGLKFNMITCKGFDAVANAVEADSTGYAIGILPEVSFYTDNENLLFSDVTTSSTALLVTKQDTPTVISRVAYPSYCHTLCYLTSKKGFTGREYPSDEACLAAVMRGEVDAAMVKSFQIQSVMRQSKFKNELSVLTDPVISYKISLALPANVDRALLGILNKSAAGISSEKLYTQMEVNDSLGTKRISLRQILMENWYLFTIGLLLILAMTVIIILQQRFNRQLEISNRNKDVFLADMSHDFRTPLTAISGFAYLGKSESDPRYYPDIITSVAYMQELVNDILNIRQYSEGKSLELQPEPVMAETLYDSILSVMHGRAAAKNIKIDFDSRISYPYISVDPMRVRQVFVNIIGNAIKYSPAGSTVEVAVEDYVKSHEVRLRATIADHGEGMSQDFIKRRMFRPFEREKNSFSAKEGGSGLGLAITKIIMDRLGGSISVESELGRGSTFTLDFPETTITKEDYERNHKDNGSLKSKEYDFSGLNVLLCEDNEINTFIVTNLLQKKGCNVDSAENGRLGLEKFTASPPGHYGLVLMDIRMPEMDGIEAARAIRALDRDDARAVPIVALSANAFEEDKMASAKAGMNAHLSKPIDVDALFRTVEQLLALS
ncbi:MAG: response regulator [Treponema sp.]|nr:response regulator [Treponema sp.]